MKDGPNRTTDGDEFVIMVWDHTESRFLLWAQMGFKTNYNEATLRLDYKHVGSLIMFYDAV